MKDPILVCLIALAELDPPDEHEVTLMTGGFLVSGTMISYQAYVQHNDLISRIDSFERKQLPGAKDFDQNRFDFIHLRGAKYSGPDGKPLFSGDGPIFARISLDSVQGFFLGTLE